MIMVESYDAVEIINDRIIKFVEQKPCSQVHQVIIQLKEVMMHMLESYDTIVSLNENHGKNI